MNLPGKVKIWISIITFSLVLTLSWQVTSKIFFQIKTKSLFEFKERNKITTQTTNGQNINKYIINLSRPLNWEEIKNLPSWLEVSGSLGENSLLVRCSSVELAKLKKLPFLKEVKPYVPKDYTSIFSKTDFSNKQLDLTVWSFNNTDKPRLANEVIKRGGTVLKGLDEEGLTLRIRLPATALPDLTHAPYVTHVEPYYHPSFLNDRAASIIGATPLLAPGFINSSGLNGIGQVVGIADSGLSTGKLGELHPDLQDIPGQKPKVIMLKSWAKRKIPDDPIGHGTHMAATIAGTGLSSKGKYAGLASGASLYFQAILNEQGETELPADLSTLYRPAHEADVHIYVNGWGGKTNAYLTTAAQTDEFIRKNPDFVVIFGAGNRGPEKGSLTPEANSKNALVVGASENVRPAFGPNTDNAQDLASFSSPGPAADGRLKPDLVAPGSGIISATSPLIKSNFSPNPLYTQMQGTSMATAITAGAAACLREYFQNEEKVALPTAALLKAALINGATPLLKEGAGFGLLDLATTVLSLKEKAFFYVDERNPVTENQTRSYTFKVTSNTQPFKATLAWTDPAVLPGATKTLVNDLDLIVTAPDGKKYLGNDVNQAGQKDDKNNVEQVLIPEPLPGTYTVSIHGTAIRQGIKSAANPGQDFALVYGQPVAKETIADINKNTRQLKLSNGETIDFPDTGKNISGKKLTTWDLNYILPGEDVYFNGESQLICIVGKVWHESAHTHFPLSSNILFLEANPKMREGGFYLNNKANKTFWANGLPVKDVESIPTGAEIFASVNPSSQTLWFIKTDFLKEEGFIKEINLEKHLLTLLPKNKAYPLNQDVAFSFTDRLENSSFADSPFGFPVSYDLQQLAPAMAVKLILSPLSGEVSYLAVERSLTVGSVIYTDPAQGRVDLENGKSYYLIANAPVTLDGQPAKLDQIKPGNQAALLLADNQIITIIAHTKTLFGQVIYLSGEYGTLHLLDHLNQLHILKITPETKLFRWWQPGELSTLLPGEWVRTILQPNSEEVSRVDVALATEGNSTLTNFNPITRIMAFSNEKEAYTSPQTMITKNGYLVQANDILPGDKVEYTILEVPGYKRGLLAQVKGRARENAKPPMLEASCFSRGKKLFITGYTSGNMVYAYQEQGKSGQAIVDAKGYFTIEIDRGTGENLQLVAVDRRTGGVTGKYFSIVEQSWFKDISNSFWAAKEINSLAEEGLLTGYPGGKFLPQKPVTRAEFTVMVMRLLRPAITEKSKGYFSDSIPVWAEDMINAAAQKGIITGYPDGYFYPNKTLNRTEAAIILARFLNLNLDNSLDQALPYKDQTSIPQWSMSAVSAVYNKGIFTGYPGDYFAPAAELTRAQAAVILWRATNIPKT